MELQQQMKIEKKILEEEILHDKEEFLFKSLG